MTLVDSSFALTDVAPGPELVDDRASAVESSDHPACGLLKRTVDVTVALVMLVVLLPVLLVIALIVRMGSPGPIFFRQERLGRGARRFHVLKFRTMHAGTGIDAHVDHVARVLNGEAPEPRADGLHKLVDESRFVPFGGLLRRLSLDELPQLINVLKGDMSLVGPRPTLAVELELCPDGHWRRRLEVRPGMTGLWQVSGRNRMSMVEMFDLDVDYVERWTPGLDISILARTIPAVLRAETT